MSSSGSRKQDLLFFDAIGAEDRARVGGKGLSLGLLTQAGFAVPPGFCVCAPVGEPSEWPGPGTDKYLSQSIAEACERIGAMRWAVRSSSVAEDGATASYAGQQETVLGAADVPEIMSAIDRCRQSLQSQRARAYRRQQGQSDNDARMAVVVQKLIDAEAAGILFSHDPLDLQSDHAVVESSWGLGESVVSGRVNPDRFLVDRQTGRVLQSHVGTKESVWTLKGSQPTPLEMRIKRSLTDAQLAELADLARRIEAYFGDPRDVEWAWAEGRLWVLQARPITTQAELTQESIRREEIAALRAKAAPEGTVWSRYNLAEILPEPTPMTWAIVKRFLSGRGGLGLMYRDLGYEPDPALDEDGIYDLIAGRPYCNLSREPRMQCGALPFEHRFAELKADLSKATYPRATPNPAKAGWKFWLTLPYVLFKERRANLEREKLAADFPTVFENAILHPYLNQMAQRKKTNLAERSNTEIHCDLETCIREVLIQFGRHSLKPTAFAAIALERLHQQLVPALGENRSRQAVAELIHGVRPPIELNLNVSLQRVASGELSRDEFVIRFGHRGNQEMELAQPRWQEEPPNWNALPVQSAFSADALAPDITLESLGAEFKFTSGRLIATQRLLKEARQYIALRESCKHYLLLGYAEIRRLLVELDRRFRLSGGIFFLTPDELSSLISGRDFAALIQERRRRRQIALRLELPPVIFSDDLEALGRPPAANPSSSFNGVPISAGVAEGPALVLYEPPENPPALKDYVLVCPSTDPGWAPLFAGARALVMETGGVLSHGAIVAREFGLPAVAGLPGITRQIHPGMRIQVNGSDGKVSILKDAD